MFLPWLLTPQLTATVTPSPTGIAIRIRETGVAPDDLGAVRLVARISPQRTIELAPTLRPGRSGGIIEVCLPDVTDYSDVIVTDDAHGVETRIMKRR